MLPARTHVVVLVSKIHKPTMRAVAYARAMRPSTLEAITVSVDADETRALQADWDRRGIPVPLKVLDSPFREVTDPVIEYVRALRSGSPRDLVTVLIPEYVVGHWWEHLLHNQSALRLKTPPALHPRASWSPACRGSSPARPAWPSVTRGSPPVRCAGATPPRGGGLS